MIYKYNISFLTLTIDTSDSNIKIIELRGEVYHIGYLVFAISYGTS